MHVSDQGMLPFVEPVQPVTSLPKPSDEQAAILDAWRSDPYSDMDVQSAAGTGKTKTAEMIAAQDGRRGIYICYNASIRAAAERRFKGRRVKCRTGHSLAYTALRIYEQQHRLSARLFGNDVADLLGIPNAGSIRRSTLGTWVLHAIDRYCNSASRSITHEHVVGAPPNSMLAHSIVGWASQLWTEMCDPMSSVPITHDSYLKQYQLKGMTLPADADYAIIDEAQDVNPVFGEIIERAACPIIKFGDTYQSIYLHRGAVDAMRDDCGRTFHLSHSWRFGPRVATVARSILSHVSVPPRVPLQGSPHRDTQLVETLEGSQTIICRTNAQLFSEAVATKGRIHIVGEGKELLALIAGAWTMFTGGRADHVPLLARFQDYDDLADHAKDTNDRELVLLTRIVTEYGSAIPTLVDDVARRLVPDRAGAELVLTSGHRFKGDESANVRLADDFPTLAELDATDKEGKPRFTPAERDQELNLLYVAATRATTFFCPNDAVRSCVSAALAQAKRKQQG